MDRPPRKRVRRPRTVSNYIRRDGIRTPTYAEQLVRIVKRMPELRLCDYVVRCSWCNRVATTWFRKWMACDEHETRVSTLACEWLSEGDDDE